MVKKNETNNQSTAATSKRTTKKATTTRTRKPKAPDTGGPTFDSVSDPVGGTELMAKTAEKNAKTINEVVNEALDQSALVDAAHRLDVHFPVRLVDDPGKEWAHKYLNTTGTKLFDAAGIAVDTFDHSEFKSLTARISEMFFMLLNSYYDNGTFTIDKQQVRDVLSDIAMAALEENPDMANAMQNYDVKGAIRTIVIEEFLKEDAYINDIVNEVINLNEVANGNMAVFMTAEGLSFSPIKPLTEPPHVGKHEPIDMVYMVNDNKVVPAAGSVIDVEPTPITDNIRVVVDADGTTYIEETKTVLEVVPPLPVEKQLRYTKVDLDTGGNPVRNMTRANKYIAGLFSA